MLEKEESVCIAIFADRLHILTFPFILHKDNGAWLGVWVYPPRNIYVVTPDISDRKARSSKVCGERSKKLLAMFHHGGGTNFEHKRPAENNTLAQTVPADKWMRNYEGGKGTHHHQLS